MSKKSARLFHCTPFKVEEIEIEGMPGSLAEVLKREAPEKQRDFRTLPAGTAAPATSKGPALFHGHGTGVDDEKDIALRYCRKVDKALQQILHNEKAPLVFAGVDCLFSIYKEASSYKHLVDEAVNGNPDLIKPEELQKEALKIVQPYFEKSKLGAANRFRETLGTGLASKDYREIIRAAFQGRVETLFVAEGVQLWGTHNPHGFDPKGNDLLIRETEQPGDEDLLDCAAVQTILHGGTVYLAKPDELPDRAPLGSLFRY